MSNSIVTENEYDFLKGDGKSKTDIVDCENKEDQECLTDFIDSISQEISVSCAIPFQLPKKSIAQLVKNSKELFYQIYCDATEYQYLHVPYKFLHDKLFKKSIDTVVGKDATRGRLILPTKVYSVIGVYELGGFRGESGGFGGWHSADGDFTVENQLWGNTLYSNYAMAADNIMYYIVSASFIDQSRQLFQHPLGYKYNRLSRRLTFTGELPKKDVILNVMTTIDDCDLFADYWFRRYVIAECKIQLNRILSAFQYQLPGNASINTEAIANEGMSERNEIIQELKTQKPNDYMLMF